MLKDTSEKVEQIYINKLKEKTDIERAFMGFSMFETSRCLVKKGAKVHSNNPRDIKIAIFDRFYSRDFDLQTRNRIIERF